MSICDICKTKNFNARRAQEILTPTTVPAKVIDETLRWAGEEV
jgi:hypothetical protein